MSSSSYPRTLEEWVETVRPDGEDLYRDAQFIVESGRERGWVRGSLPDVLGLSIALWHEPPDVLPPLSSFQALALASLALASVAFEAEIVPGYNQDPGDALALAARVREKVTAVQRYTGEESGTALNQRAAYVAVRQLGGWQEVGIPRWVQIALGDSENVFWIDDHLLDRVALACQTTNPGRRWRHVYQIGVIVYE